MLPEPTARDVRQDFGITELEVTLWELETKKTQPLPRKHWKQKWRE